VPESLTQDSPTQFRCFQYPGFGQYSRVVITEFVFGVYSRTYASHDNVTVLSSLGNEAFCPRNVRAIPCSHPLRSYCDGTISGSCVCLNSSTTGFFSGAVCDPWHRNTGCSVR
jgi:hypothetical protein